MIISYNNTNIIRRRVAPAEAYATYAAFPYQSTGADFGSDRQNRVSLAAPWNVHWALQLIETLEFTNFQSRSAN